MRSEWKKAWSVIGSSTAWELLDSYEKNGNTYRLYKTDEADAMYVYTSSGTEGFEKQMKKRKRKS